MKWSLWNFYGGGRRSFLSGAAVRPFVNAGAILGRGTYELKDLRGAAVEIRSSGLALGWYVGGGIAARLSEKATLQCPIRFNILSTAEYSYEGITDGFSNDWKAAPYVTVGLGLTFALI
jgi:hypothetical protein